MADSTLESTLMSNGPSLPQQAANVQQATSAPSPAPDVSAVQPSESSLGSLMPEDTGLPRFQRTFGNTLKGMLVGLGLGGIPGMIAGGASPTSAAQALKNRRDTTQADVTFANARAAHEIAMAHQADAEYQALPEKLQQESAARGLENLQRARQAGYMPVANVPLDQGQAQNSQNAMTALDQVKQQFGAVPQGLLYIHTGNGMTVLKLQDPNAALDTINNIRKAQGMPAIDPAAFATLNPNDKDSMARDAINFSDPRDINGTITQNSLNIANMRLSTVKVQPDFNGKDALVKSLQTAVDNQKAVLDAGATQEATRKGQAVGAQAQAAQPGQTAAQVANINATAGPEARAAGMKAEATAEGAAKGQLAGGGGPGTGITSPQTGADEGYLNTLPPTLASQIRAIGEGRIEFSPRGAMAKLLPQLTTAYPGFDASKAQSYFKTRQDFTSGKTSTAINSYNTAIAHLGTIYDHVSNSSSVMINTPGTEVHRQLELDKQLVSTELAKAVSNSQMTEKEKSDILSSIAGATVNSYKERVKEAVTLLNGKLEAFQNQWQNAAPPGAVSQVQILGPQAKATIAKINGQSATQTSAAPFNPSKDFHPIQ